MTHMQEEPCAWRTTLAKVLSIAEKCLVFVLITLSFHASFGNMENILPRFSTWNKRMPSTIVKELWR